MGDSLKLVAALALAACAMLSFVRAIEPCQSESVSSAYASDHKIVPNPILGVRG